MDTWEHLYVSYRVQKFQDAKGETKTTWAHEFNGTFIESLQDVLNVYSRQGWEPVGVIPEVNNSDRNFMNTTEHLLLFKRRKQINE